MSCLRTYAFRGRKEASVETMKTVTLLTLIEVSYWKNSVVQKFFFEFREDIYGRSKAETSVEKKYLYQAFKFLCPTSFTHCLIKKATGTTYSVSPEEFSK